MLNVPTHLDCLFYFYFWSAAVQGFNPVWMETFVFDVTMPALAMLCFAVMDEDMFGDPNFVGQSCVPIQQLQNGKTNERTLQSNRRRSNLLCIALFIVYAFFDRDSVGSTAERVQ